MRRIITHPLDMPTAAVGMAIATVLVVEMMKSGISVVSIVYVILLTMLTMAILRKQYFEIRYLMDKKV